ncbi:MAG TPA: NAD(P)H-dependent oxidoreductase [Gaiella sp.]|jgi:chromate reductase|nr:NAD(P)H-dependent oxidoreductase [Gaiella sp.]
MKILGLAGSLRADSLNAQLLRLTAEELPDGVELDVFGGLAEIPPFDQDLEDLAPEAVEALKAAIADADAVLVATPEYNGSIPGQLKNALDWVSRPIRETPIRGKPVAAIGASTGAFGAVWAQRELKKVLGLMGARVLDVELPVAKADRRLEDPDPELREQLSGVVDVLVAAVTPAPAGVLS